MDTKCRPISFLSIFSKIFERLIFKSLFNYFIQNKHFTECQPGFIPGDSYVPKILSITHKIYESFHYNPPADMRGIFSDISKAFAKVWHEGLIFKLKSYGIGGDLLKLLINYLENRKQRALLNGQASYILSHILFLIYINNLPDGMKSICKFFVDDTSRYSKVKEKDFSAVELNNDLKIRSDWAIQWKMLFNSDFNKQAVEIIFSKNREKDNYPPLTFNGDNVQITISQKHLSLVLDSKLGFNEHISNKINKCNK